MGTPTLSTDCPVYRYYSTSMVPIGTPLLNCPCWSTIGWPGGTEGLVESVLRISPSTGSSGVSIAIEWDEWAFDHRALVSLERLGVQVLGATGQQVVTAVPWIPPLTDSQFGHYCWFYYVFTCICCAGFMSQNRVVPIQYGVGCVLRNYESERKWELIELLND